ncbi:MAG: nucleoside phosphorylase [Chloroflexota bacterium]|nr:nucleoside phosphorylase [Chloroflexota bacterium]
MSYPNFEGKHLHEALIDPVAHAAYMRLHGLLPVAEPVPQAFIITYQRKLFDRAVQLFNGTKALSAGEVHQSRTAVSLVLDSGQAPVGVAGNFGFGAPVTTIVMESLIALGARRVLSIGTAGALQPGLQAGDVVVCDRAIRDEGVSHHYAPPAKYAQASAELTSQLETALDGAGLAHRRGTSWTIDTPYRETAEEARHYRAEGVLTVEMEAAAIFAVGELRGAAVASAFVVSDLLSESSWEPSFHSPLVDDRLGALLEAAVDLLSSAP